MEEFAREHVIDWVIYPGDQTYSLDEKITVIPLEQLAPLAAQLKAGY